MNEQKEKSNLHRDINHARTTSTLHSVVYTSVLDGYLFIHVKIEIHSEKFDDTRPVSKQSSQKCHLIIV